MIYARHRASRLHFVVTQKRCFDTAESACNQTDVVSPRQTVRTSPGKEDTLAAGVLSLQVEGLAATVPTAACQRAGRRASPSASAWSGPQAARIPITGKNLKQRLHGAQGDGGMMPLWEAGCGAEEETGSRESFEGLWGQKGLCRGRTRDALEHG